jgi:hypothetical protein
MNINYSVHKAPPEKQKLNVDWVAGQQFLYNVKLLFSKEIVHMKQLQRNANT